MPDATQTSPAPVSTLQAYGDPNAYFMTQAISSLNPDAKPYNRNCGPTSLGMALKAFHKVPPGTASVTVEDFIEGVRQAMTGQDDVFAPTYTPDIIKGAQACGINAEHIVGQAGLDAALAEGKQVVTPGDPIVYDKRFTSTQYAAPYDGGHFILVVDHQGTNYVIDDPLSLSGSLTITSSELAAYMAYQNWNDGAAVWP